MWFDSCRQRPRRAMAAPRRCEAVGECVVSPRSQGRRGRSEAWSRCAARDKTSNVSRFSAETESVAWRRTLRLPPIGDCGVVLSAWWGGQMPVRFRRDAHEAGTPPDAPTWPRFCVSFVGAAAMPAGAARRRPGARRRQRFASSGPRGGLGVTFELREGHRPRLFTEARMASASPGRGRRSAQVESMGSLIGSSAPAG